MKHYKIFNKIESTYPLYLSEKWDKSGLQVGNPYNTTKGIGFALDPSLKFIYFLKENGLNLGITHHPMGLNKIFPIDISTYNGKLISESIKNNITLYSAHTNFDSGEYSVSTFLVDKIGLKYKALEHLTNTKDQFGYGEIVTLLENIKIIDLLNVIKNKFSLNYLRFIGNIDKVVQKIALMGGAGASFIEHAYKAGVELYITGDIKYHDARLAEQLGITVIDMGHFYSEYLSIEHLQKMISTIFDREKLLIFTEEKDPFNLWR